MDPTSHSRSNSDDDTNQEGTQFSHPEVASNVGAGASKSSKRIRSDIWQYYLRVEERDALGHLINVKATCIKCKKYYAAHPKNGTSHLTRHSDACNKQKNINQMFLSQSSSSGSLGNYTYDQKEARRSIVQWLVRKNLPFLIIDDTHFENMIQSSLQPAFKKFSRHTAKRDCMKIFNEEKEALKTLLENNKSKFYFTSDI